jgi:2-dehydro-3-deoxy-D-arabinonate dehydratase
VIPDLALCRFAATDAGAHLGLIAHGQLYDLRALGQSQYLSFEAFLRAASGRAQQALADLAQVPASVKPLVAADALLDPSQALRILAPLDTQEVWACGVTYEMSREARMHESQSPTLYGKVYDAPRPEIFFKATPHRVVGPGEAVAVRGDSAWDVPEPELAFVLTPGMEIIGYTIGNDMSSRDIEGQNPLYLPQAKVYDRCCALGPFVRLPAADFNPLSLSVTCVIYRNQKPLWAGQTHTNKIHRTLEELASYLGRCNSFPTGAFVLTGTGTIPPDTVSLMQGDTVAITFEGLGTLCNPVIKLDVA